MITEIASPQPEHLSQLRQLWQAVFGDDDAFLDKFFSIAFHPDRCLCALDAGIPVAAIYWMDAMLRGEKVAYLYALATAEAHRGRGIARQLMHQAQKQLLSQGYRAALLVPANKRLGQWYQRLGYEYCGQVAEFSCTASGAPVPLRPVTAAEYHALREKYLPQGSIRQDTVTLEFLASHSQLYAGEDFLLAVQISPYHTLLVPEFLGNISAVPGILSALGYPGAPFRSAVPILPADSAFRPNWLEVDHSPVMFRPLTTPAMAPPAYFAFPFN